MMNFVFDSSFFGDACVSIGCSFKFPVKVGVEMSIVNAPLVVGLQIKNSNVYHILTLKG
jgi:hypothetical protein